MPRLRSNKKSARYDPLFGPAQDGNTAPGYNVPRGITFEELRELTNRARQSGGSPISVKNQIRAVVAAAGLTSAAAGALTLRAYQYVDQTFGKRPRGSDASETSADHSRLRGVKEPRTIDPELPSYEEVSSREDEFVEETGEKFGDAVETAFTVEDDDDAMQQIAREEQKEADLQGIRNVLLSMHGDTGDFVVDASDQHTSSFDDLPSGQQVEDPLEYHPDISTMPVQVDDDQVMNEEGTVSAMRVASASTGPGSSANSATPVKSIVPRFPFRNTEEAILKFHGCVSTGILRIGSNNALRIRMNTPIAPFSETTGTVGSQVSWNAVTNTWAGEILGRYVCAPYSDGLGCDENVNRQLNIFKDQLFAGGSIINQVPSGSAYYNLHYGAYTVVKCEWSIRVEMPYHMYVSDDKSATPTDVTLRTNLNLTGQANYPPASTAARVFTHYTMTGDQIAAVNPPINVSVEEMERWDNVYDNKVTVPVNGVRVIRGVWKPGMVKHNVLNDDDIQVWSATGAVPASSHLEHLVVQFRERSNANSYALNVYGINVAVNLAYTVQYKEPKTEIQYPQYNQTNLSGTAVNNLVLQNPAQVWSFPT